MLLRGRFIILQCRPHLEEESRGDLDFCYRNTTTRVRPWTRFHFEKMISDRFTCHWATFASISPCLPVSLLWSQPCVLSVVQLTVVQLSVVQGAMKRDGRLLQVCLLTPDQQTSLEERLFGRLALRGIGGIWFTLTRSRTIRELLQRQRFKEFQQYWTNKECHQRENSEESVWVRSDAMSLSRRIALSSTCVRERERDEVSVRCFFPCLCVSLCPGKY